MKEKAFVTDTRIGFTILFSLLLNPSFAQQYPVQATALIMPPYSVFLADYVSPENDNLQLMLYLREITRTEYKVKLRVKIEGPNVRLASKPSYLPPPIVISGGATTILSGFDIRGYFHSSNLDFTGISKTEFTRTGRLPEGFYTITIEALDYGRGSVVSNISTASAWMILNDPPFINIPFNNEKIVATDPQNIMFSWTPRHTASPNAAFNTEYEFRLVEIYPSNRNPEDAIRSSNSIFSIRTSLTSLNYGVADPLLIPGRKYAFRVRAMDMSGRDLFKNNGYGVTHVFQYGDACVPPTDLTAEALDDRRVKIMWTDSKIHTSYRLNYRAKGTETWWQEPVYSDYLIIPDLNADTDYEYQLKGVCGTIHGSFSPIANIKTFVTAELPYECGADPLPFELIPDALPRPLQINDWIKMNSMEIRITELRQNADKSYTGLGTAQVPMFNLAHVRMKFRNIVVNDQMRVIRGNVSTVYNPNSKFARVVDLSGNDGVGSSTSFPFDSASTSATPVVSIPVVGVIDSIAVDTVNNKIFITLTDGTTQNIDQPLDASGNETDASITDSNGNVWTVDRNGNVTGGTTASSSTEANADGLDAFGSLLLEVLNEIQIENTRVIDSLKEHLQAEKSRLTEILLSAKYDPFILSGIDTDQLSEGVSQNIEDELDETATDERQNQLRIIVRLDFTKWEKEEANRQIDAYKLSENFDSVRSSIESSIDRSQFNESSEDVQKSILRAETAKKIATDLANK